MNQEKWLGLTLLLVCAAFWFWIIPNQTPGPREAFVPRLIILFMALPSLLLFFRNKPGQSPDKSGLRIFFKATLPSIALFLIFLLAVNKFGFFSSGIVFAFCALLLYGERRLTFLIFLPLGLFGLIWLVVVYWLKFPLPQGAFI